MERLLFIIFSFVLISKFFPIPQMLFLEAKRPMLIFWSPGNPPRGENVRNVSLYQRKEEFRKCIKC